MLDWKDLDIDEITEWPFKSQILIVLISFLMIQGLGYWFFLQPLIQDLEQEKQQEISLKNTVIDYSNKGKEVPIIEGQLNHSISRYRTLIQQLPTKKELTNMLSTINQIGLKNKLTLTRVNWGEKRRRQFLYQLPLNMELIGRYHDMGLFVQAVAELAIINFEYLEIQRVSDVSSELYFQIEGYIYQFRGEE